MMRSTALLFATLAGPVFAGPADVIEQQILPSFGAFSQATAALHDAAVADCQPAAVIPAYNAAFDAWLAVGHLRIGPTEEGALHVAFWPDDRGFTPKTLNGLIAAQDPVIDTPATMETLSIAAKGLFALDMMLFDPAFNTYTADSYSCRLVIAITENLAIEAAEQEAAWRSDFAPILLGEVPNADGRTLTEREAFQTLYTQIVSGVENNKIQRVDRPLGTFDRPRARRAEAWRSERSLQNILVSTDAMVREAQLLMGADLPLTLEWQAAMHKAAAKIDDPTFADIEADSGAWLKLQIVGEQIDYVKSAIEVEIGSVLGIEAGFNSSDGD